MGRERPGKEGASFESDGKVREVGGAVEAHSCEDDIDDGRPRFCLVEILRDDRCDRSRESVLYLLGKESDPEQFLSRHRPVIRGEFVCDDLEKRRLSGSIPAKQADTFAGLDLEIDCVEEWRQSVGLGDV